MNRIMSFMTVYSKGVCLKKMQNRIPWVHILMKCAAHGNVSNYSLKIIDHILSKFHTSEGSQTLLFQ